jgi:hypothetical protein
MKKVIGAVSRQEIDSELKSMIMPGEEVLLIASQG